MGITEIAKLQARPGMGDTLAAQLPLALRAVVSGPGCLRATVFREIESSDTFVCEIEWTSVEAHEAWRDSPNLETYRRVIGDLERRPIEFSHYEVIHQVGGDIPGT